MLQAVTAQARRFSVSSLAINAIIIDVGNLSLVSFPTVAAPVAVESECSVAIPFTALIVTGIIPLFPMNRAGMVVKAK